MDDIISREWASFERAVVPPGAGKVQRREMRRAFYAGAGGLFAVLGSGDIDEPEQAVLDRIESIRRELDEWAKQVMDGVA